MDYEKESCEYCEFVDRGYDQYCHEVHGISERCPVYKTAKLFLEINGFPLPLELATRHTGCKKFKEDLKYKQFNEEMDELNRKRNEEYEKSKKDKQ